MANMHSEFQIFHERVALPPGKRETLRKSRDATRDHIKKYFKEKLEVTVPEFREQGSDAMGTITNPLDGEYDLDDGVYLQHLHPNDKGKWPSPETVHGWLVKATEGRTKDKPIDKRTCVRVRYAGEYHIDLPSYALLNGKCMLAEKGEKGWHTSDPIALTDWFVGRVKARGEQLRRTVRYLKAWVDYQTGKRGKMPSGLILTVLVAQNFRGHEKDDISLANTARAISDAVRSVFCVYNPVDSSEELTVRLSQDEKKRFQEAIADLSSDGSKAIETDSNEDASKHWCGQLGDRFPLIEEEENGEKKQKKEDAARLAAFYVPRNPPKPWASH